MLKSTKKISKIKKIYLDYASGVSANSSSLHEFGLVAKEKLRKARKKFARVLNCRGGEIIFTSGGTESNNLAIFGLVRNFKNSHIITTNIEHASVLETCKYLEKTRQAQVTFVKVEKNGIVDPKKIKKAFKKNTVLVSVMYANNEIGTVQPIEEIGKVVRHHNKSTGRKLFEWSGRGRDPEIRGPEKSFPSRAFFHTDAVQAANYLDLNVARLGVDMLSLNSAKISLQKGIGALYVKSGTPVTPIMFGGNQEGGLRPGTENVEAVEKFAQALEFTQKIKDKESKRLTKLRDYFFEKLSKMSRLNLDIKVVMNGDLENRLPNNVNITIPNIPSDLLVIELSARGIMVSSKSACKQGDGKASHVIKAINKNAKDSDGSLRFSLGRETTKKDINYTIKSLKEIMVKLKKWYH